MKIHKQIGKSSIDFTNDPLIKLRADMEGAGNWYVKVGLLGSSATRRPDPNNPSPLSNPDLGAIHEFGSFDKGIPARSFLRMPLGTRLPAVIAATGRQVWGNMILTKGFEYSLRQLGMMAVDIIQDAFTTKGFGKWAPLSPKTLMLRRRRKPPFLGTMILIVSAQLRRAVKFKVVKAK